jgi:hypothetical protein
MKKPKKVDLELLKEKIRIMKPGRKLYKALKTELKALGYWKQKRKKVIKCQEGNTLQ